MSETQNFKNIGWSHGVRGRKYKITTPHLMGAPSPDLRFATFEPWAQLLGFKTDPNVSSDLKIGGRRFFSTSHLDFLCAPCSICRDFGRKYTHFRHKKLPSFFSTDIWAFLIAFWVFTIALVVFVHVPVLLRSNFYILRADLKCAILETGRNITFGALLESLGATNISGFVATALFERKI